MSTSKSSSNSSGQVDTSTSGQNAKASASGGGWTEKSQTKDGKTITERVFNPSKNDGSKADKDDSETSSTWEWITGSKTQSAQESDAKTRADAATDNSGTSAKASAGSGKAWAGIVNGKAVSTAG